MVAGEQFPITRSNYVDYWWNATGARYDEFDIERNIEIETDAAAIAADSGRLGNQIVYLTNSAGGLRAMKTTAKTTGSNIKGIVTYESIGYVFPIGDPDVAAGGVTLCTSPTAACAFGPLGVSIDDFKKIASLKIQFVWGDHQPKRAYTYVKQSRLCAQLLNKYSAQYNLRRPRGSAEAWAPMRASQEARTSRSWTWTTTRSSRFCEKFLKTAKLDK